MAKFLIKKEYEINNTICGIDEAGRGALAGPLVVAAVVFPEDFALSSVEAEVVIKDSKFITKNQRHALYDVIMEQSLVIAVVYVSVENIDGYGINWAQFTAFKELVRLIDASKYIIDGRWNLPDFGQRTSKVVSRIHADEEIPSVLASGIVAKIEWDKMMSQLHLKYPFYNWDSNTGHGTKQHIQAIINHGTTPYHRSKFVETALSNYEKRYGGKQ
jgi:ribonuclease HII